MIGEFSQDHPLNLTVDAACRIVGELSDRSGHRLLRHDCTATHGASGAPVLVNDDATWRIGGIEVAATVGEAGGIAINLAEVRHQLASVPEPH